jgi:oligopeptide/dipeptide ABC transporter ATP-binding protein
MRSAEQLTPVSIPGVKASTNEELLRVEGLSTNFHDPEHGAVRAVKNVSLSVRPGETLGLVGESGSGKSVTMMSVMGLIKYSGGRVVSGQAYFEGQDLLTMSPKQLREVRGARIGMIFQDPMTCLNPVLTIGRQLAEPLRKHLGLDKAAARRKVLELLDIVHIPDPLRRIRAFPHELSGGMRQRVMIAMALACDPVLLIADEPTTALDVTVQAQILELIGEAARERNMAVVLISHDLGVIAGLADRIAVMYSGSVVETGAARDVLKHPRHPYTVGLLRSSPRLDGERLRVLNAIPGAPPDIGNPPPGCSFQPRCPIAVDKSAHSAPPLRRIAGDTSDHFSACWVDLDDNTNFDGAWKVTE